MKTPYSNDYEHARLKNRLWALEFVIFIICLLLAGISQAQVVTNISPAHLETDVDIETEIIVTFDVPVTINEPTASVHLFNVDDGFSTLYEFQMQDPEVVVSSRTLTVTLPEVLPPNTTVSFRIDGDAITDYVGLFVHQFTTEDDVPPTIVSTNPASGATDVDIFTDLTLTFSEDVQINSGFISVVRTDIGSTLDLFIVPDPSVTVSGDQVTIDISNLPMSKPIQVNIGGRSIEDLNGHAFTGLYTDAQTQWTFTTEDPTPPQVVSLSPDDESTDIPISGQTFTITFDEDIQETGYFRIYTGSGTLEDFQNEELTYIGTNAISFTPTVDFELGSDYSITFNSVRDLKGAQLTVNDTDFWNFSTIEATPPQLTSLYPADDAINVALDANLVMTFDENVFLQNDGDFDVIEVREAVGGALFETFDLPSANVTGVGSNVIVMNPTSNFADDTKYYIRILSAFEDNYGTDFENINNTVTWNFDTGQPPVLVSNTPTHNNTDITVDANLVLEFDQPMILGTSPSPGISVWRVSDAGLVDFIQLNSGEATGFGTNTITLNPVSDLPNGEELYVTIPANVLMDQQNDLFTGWSDNTIWRFTTEAAPDVTPPSVSGLSPVNGASDIATDQWVYEITFDEPIQEGNGFAQLKKYSNEGLITNANPINHISVSGNVATIDFNALGNLGIELDHATQYYVEVQSGLFEDLAGNDFSGLTKTQWNFTTEAAPDLTPPSISSLNPAHNSLDVSATQWVFEITFDEPIQKGSGGVFLRVYSSDGLYTNGDLINHISVSGNTATIDFNALGALNALNMNYSTRYYIDIQDGVFEDLAGNDYAGHTKDSWSFTTEAAPDTDPPTVITFNPSDEGEEVQIDAILQILFNEPVQSTGLATDAEIRRKSDNGLLASATLNNPIQAGFSGPTLSLNFSPDLPYDTEVYVTIPTNAIEDLNGNDFQGFSGNESWDFFTEEMPDNDPPLIVSLTPINGGTDIGISDNLTIEFNEDILFDNNMSTFELRRKSPDELVEAFDIFGSRVTGDNTTTVTIDPTNDLLHEVEYYFLIGNDVFIDNGDNAFAGLLTSGEWSFTTVAAPDLTPPSFTGLTPTDDASDISVTNWEYTIEFDELIQAGSGIINLRKSTGDVLITTAAMNTVRVDINDDQATIDFNADGALNAFELDHLTEYYIEIPLGAFEDLAGNDFPGIAKPDWSFTTEMEVDNTAPTITNFSPTNGATDVANDAPIVLTFNEDIQLTGFGPIRIRRASNNGFLHDIDPASAQVEIVGSTVTITPTGGFLSAEEEIEVYVNWSTTPFEDLAGNDFNGLFGTSDYRFTVNNTNPDDVSPTITAFTPADDATGVSTNITSLGITFDEDVQKFHPGNIIIRDGGGSILDQYFPVSTDGNVSVDGNQVTITLNETLEFGTTYYVQLASTTFEDLAGNPGPSFTDADTWNFTTAAAPDIVPPFLSSTSPAHNEIGVSISLAAVSATFSEPIKLMDPANMNGGTIQEIGDEISPVYSFGASDVTIDGNTLSISTSVIPDGLVHDTQYVVNISSFFVSDLANNPFIGTLPDSWSFTTEEAVIEDLTPPSITSFSPEDDAMDVPLDATISVTFDEPLNDTKGRMVIYETAQGTFRILDVAFSNLEITGNTATVLSLSPFSLQAGKDYHIAIVSGSFEDLNGNAFDGFVDEMTWNFSTIPADETAPVITSLSPNHNQSDVEVDANLQITFDEPIFFGSGPTSAQLRKVGGGFVQDFFNNDNVYTDITGNTLTLDPLADLEYDQEYYVTLGQGFVEDESGNESVAKSDVMFWNFTTRLPDDTDPPVFTNLSPINGATGVALDADLTITFDEPIVGSAFGGFVRVLKMGTTQQILGGRPAFEADQFTVSGNTLTIHLAEWTNVAPQHDTEYYVTVQNGSVEDLTGNLYPGFTDDATWNFTTEAEPDNTAPQVTSLLPSNGATDVETDANLILTFDEEIQKGSGGLAIQIRRSIDDVLLQNIPVGNSIVSVDVNTVIINPSGTLPTETQLYVTVEAGAFQDMAGNGFDGISSKTEWSFTTSPAPDLTAPTVTSLNPENNATGIETDSNLEITFSEEIQKGSGGLAIQIRRSNDGVLLQNIPVGNGIVSVDGNTATIDPSLVFANETQFYVTVETGAFQDMAGNSFAGITSSTEWTFTTKPAPDLTAPTVVSLIPGNNAIGVATNANLGITFNEDVQKGSGGLAIQIRRSSDDVLLQNIPVGNGIVSVSGNNVIIDPTANFPSETQLYVTIEQGAFQDLVGNEYLGITSKSAWNFTTEQGPDLTAPSITSLSPFNGSTDVEVTTDLTLTFSEEVQLTGGGTFRMYNKANGELIGANWSFPPNATVDGNSVTYDIPIDMPYGTEIYFEITNAIEDVAGNNAPDISGDSDWVITTEGELVPPAIVSLSPANGSTDITVSTDLVLTFDEEVQLTGGGSFKMFNKSTDEQIGANWSFATFAMASGNAVTFDIPVDLPYATEVYFEITNAIEDQWENVAAPISGMDWVITTQDEPDVTSPSVLSFDPADESTDVAIDADLMITFDEEVQSNGTVDFVRLYNKTTGDNLAQLATTNSNYVIFSGNTITLNSPVDLPENTEVYVTLPADGIEDASGNLFSGWTDSETWNFTTETLPDLTAPTLVSISPTDNSTNIEVDSDLILTFDEPVQGTDEGALTVRDKATDEIIGFSWFFPAFSTFNGNQVTFDLPSDLPYETEFYVTTTNGIEDLSGNRFQLTDTEAWTFTTVDNDDPTDITLSKASIDENEESSSIIGQFAAVDPNESDTHDIEFVSGEGSEDNDSFDLNGFQLRTAEVFDYETRNSYSIRVRVIDNYDNSFEKAFNISINDVHETLDQAITFEAIEGKVYDESFELSAVASSQLEVTFSVVSGPVTIEDNKTVVITGTGEATIAADQAGDTDYNAADQVTRTFTIDKANQIISIESIDDKEVTDASFEVVATVDSDLALSYQVEGPASNDGSTITLDGTAGTVTVTVSQTGNENYHSATSSTSFEVLPVKTKQEITFEVVAAKTYGDDDFDLVATSSSGLDVDFSLISGPVTLEGSTITIVGAGEVIVAADQPGDDDFLPADQVTQTFTIAKAGQIITIETIDDKLTTDDAFEVVASVNSGLELTYEVEGPASNEGAMITLEGIAGIVTLTVSQLGDDNYLEASEQVTFDVIESEVLSVVDLTEKVKIYPNPATDFIIVELEKLSSTRLLDLNGKQLLQTSDRRLDLQQIVPGIYLLEIMSDGQIIRKRIVKKN